MEEEELEEGDILWPDHHHHHHNNPCIVELPVPIQNNSTMEAKSVTVTVSAPIAIPNSGGVYCRIVDPDADCAYNNEHVDEGTGSSTTNRGCKKMVPPHVVVARRFADRMFSVCFGNGRTLRGRDLFTFRNSIFRMTGFIE